MVLSEICTLTPFTHLARQIHQLFVHVRGASIAHVCQQLHNGILGYASDARRAQDGIAFDQATENGGAFGGGERLHACNMYLHA